MSQKIARYSHGKRRKVNYRNAFRDTFREVTSDKRQKKPSIAYGRIVFKDWKGRKLST